MSRKAKSRGEKGIRAMLNDPLFWTIAVPAVILAGVSKGGFGSGAAFAAAPLLAMAVPPGLALGVMRDYPEVLRSVVLDAPYGPEVDLYLATPGSFERALATLYGECAADAACAAAYPELRFAVSSYDAPTCSRCWRRYEELVDDSELPELCARCHRVVEKLLHEGRAELRRKEN